MVKFASAAKNSHVISRVHVPRARAPSVFRPLFGDERAAHGPLAADADTREQAQNGKLPDIHDQGAEKREHGIPDDGEHERSNAAEFVSDRPPEKRESPTAEKQGEEQSTVVANIAFRGGDAGTWEEFAQRGHEHQGINE